MWQQITVHGWVVRKWVTFFLGVLLRVHTNGCFQRYNCPQKATPIKHHSLSGASLNHGLSILNYTLSAHLDFGTCNSCFLFFLPEDDSNLGSVKAWIQPILVIPEKGANTLMQFQYFWKDIDNYQPPSYLIHPM